MRRDKVTKKLERIIKTIQMKRTPIRVRKVYVFGSYARGALECADLDIVIVTDRPTQEDDRTCKDRTFLHFPDYEKAFRKLLKCAPSEKVQIVLASGTLKRGIKGRKFEPEGCVLIWNRDDRWRGRITGISPDPTAGRALRREYMFEGQGFAREEERYWQWADDGLTCGAIRLQKLPVDDFFDVKWPHIDRERECGVINTRVADISNIACTYIGRRGRTPDVSWGVPHWLPTSEDGAIRFYLGKPKMRYINAWLRTPGVKEACALPFLRKRKPNAIWVFERGRGFEKHRQAAT